MKEIACVWGGGLKLHKGAVVKKNFFSFWHWLILGINSRDGRTFCFINNKSRGLEVTYPTINRTLKMEISSSINYDTTIG